ncbi:hypothetical protein [Candidatus Nitrosarchaeum limnium]|jgi:peptidoglycan hydrolase CwlO-like protein|nr:hypothetical protein [Candidatus Nitrosarchaeum limnium]
MFSKIILLIVFCMSITILLDNSAFADVVSPKKQMKLNFSSDDVVCKEGLIRVTNVNDNHPACVKISSVTKLIKFGWALPINDVFSAMNSGEIQSVGTVKILDTVKVFGNSGILDPKPRVVGYNVILEACAKSTVRSPEIVVVSDSEAKRVKLAERIEIDTCQTTAVQIKSANPESIKATMTNKGGITAKITSLENKISGLEQNIASERAKLSGVTNDTTSTISDTTQKIVELRNNITKTKDELNRYKLALYVEPTEISGLKFKPFLESPIDGSSLTKLSVHKSNIQPQTQLKNILMYNSLFQICAKDKAIHAPEILVTSDFETQSVRLADDISPNSCQINSVQISTENPQSISISLKNKGDISSSIDELEKKVSDLQEKIKTEKQRLEILIHQTPRSLTYDLEVTKLTENIEHLRNDLNRAKVEMFSVLNAR